MNPIVRRARAPVPARRQGLRALAGLLALPGLLVLPALTKRADAAAPPAAAPALPALQPAALEYEVFLGDYTKGNRVAAMSQQFEVRDGHYRLHSESRAQGLLALVWRGSLVQTSEGQLDSQGLKPTRYEERRGDRRPRGATIDPASGQVRFLDGEQANVGPGVQDKLSALVQLGLLVAAGTAQGAPLPAGHRFEFPLLRTSRVATAHWLVEGPEELRIGAQNFQATRVRQVIQAGADSPAIDAWFDASRPPWPLRVRVTEPDGQALDQILQRAG